MTPFLRLDKDCLYGHYEVEVGFGRSADCVEKAVCGAGLDQKRIGSRQIESKIGGAKIFLGAGASGGLIIKEGANGWMHIEIAIVGNGRSSVQIRGKSFFASESG